MRDYSDVIIKESERGDDAVFAGASRLEGDYALGGDILQELVERTHVPTCAATQLIIESWKLRNA